MASKIIFMGTPDFAVPILKSIYNSRNQISAVYTQPPKKKLRGQKLVSSPVSQCAENLGIPIIRSPENLNTKNEYDFIKKLNAN